jgi:hypothetical protein
MDKDMMNIITRRRALVNKLRAKFLTTFGVPLTQYYDIRSLEGLVCGFDLIKFDEEVVKPENGESAADAIERRWGTEAVEMVKKLIMLT